MFLVFVFGVGWPRCRVGVFNFLLRFCTFSLRKNERFQSGFSSFLSPLPGTTDSPFPAMGRVSFFLASPNGLDGLILLYGLVLGGAYYGLASSWFFLFVL